MQIMEPNWYPRPEDYNFKFVRGAFEEAAFTGKFLATHPITYIAIGYAIAIRTFMTSIEETENGNVIVFNLRVDSKHDVRWFLTLDTGIIRRQVLANNEAFRTIENLPNPMTSFAQSYNEQVAHAQMKRMEFKSDQDFEKWCYLHSDYVWMVYKAKSSLLHRDEVANPFRLAYMSQFTEFGIAGKDSHMELVKDPAYLRFSGKAAEKARQIGITLTQTPEVFLNV